MITTTLTRVESARALHDLLLLVVATPAAYVHAPIADHLKSQGLLAEFESHSDRIVAGSLNTLKRASTKLAGGFEAIDRLRNQARHSLEVERRRITQASKTTKAVLTDRAKRLSSDLAAAREDLLLLTRLLERALSQGRQYATESGNAALKDRCAREQTELLDMMTLRQTSPARLMLIKGDHAAKADSP